MLMIQTFITSACDIGPNIIAGTGVMLVISFVAFPVIKNEEWTVSLTLNKIFNTCFGFVILTVLGMLITYIAQIRSIMNNYIKENFNLLNRMHEGIIVLTEEDMKVKFANKPAIELLQDNKAKNEIESISIKDLN